MSFVFGNVGKCCTTASQMVFKPEWIKNSAEPASGPPPKWGGGLGWQVALSQSPFCLLPPQGSGGRAKGQGGTVRGSRNAGFTVNKDATVDRGGALSPAERRVGRVEEGCLHINLWHCRWTASVPKKASLAVPKAWQQVNTLRGRSGPLPLVLQSQVEVGGRGAAFSPPHAPAWAACAPCKSSGLGARTLGS